MKKNWTALLFVFWAFIGILPGTVVSLVPDAPVVDSAGVLDATQKQEILNQIQSLKQETGIGLYLVSLQSWQVLGQNHSNIEQFAVYLFNSNHLESRDLLVLFAMSERECAIWRGNGYEQGYDAWTEDLINKTMIPSFKAGKYGEGLTMVARRISKGMLLLSQGSSEVDRILSGLSFPMDGAFAPENWVVLKEAEFNDTQESIARPEQQKPGFFERLIRSEYGGKVILFLFFGLVFGVFFIRSLLSGSTYYYDRDDPYYDRRYRRRSYDRGPGLLDILVSGGSSSSGSRSSSSRSSSRSGSFGSSGRAGGGSSGKW